MLLLATTLSMAHAAPADAKPKNPVARFIVSLFAAPDEDGDGINDRKDRCRVLPENFNGYADDDGCPDHLSVLDVGVWLDDRLVPGKIALTRADGTISGIQGPRAAEDLVPGEVVQVTAAYGCSITTSEFVVSPGHNRIDLDIVPDPRLVETGDGQCIPRSTDEAVAAAR